MHVEANREIVNLLAVDPRPHREIARLAGISPACLSLIVNRHHRPQVVTLARLRRVLKGGDQ
jgi:hypothetical protein